MSAQDWTAMADWDAHELLDAYGELRDAHEAKPLDEWVEKRYLWVREELLRRATLPPTPRAFLSGGVRQRTPMNDDDDSLRLYGAAKLAAFSGIGETAIREAIRSGELKTVRVGSGTTHVQRRATIAEFKAWMAARSTTLTTEHL